MLDLNGGPAEGAHLLCLGAHHLLEAAFVEYVVLAAGELDDLVRIFKFFQADGAIRLVIRKFDVVEIEFRDALNVLSDSIADLRGL